MGLPRLLGTCCANCGSKLWVALCAPWACEVDAREVWRGEGCQRITDILGSVGIKLTPTSEPSSGTRDSASVCILQKSLREKSLLVKRDYILFDCLLEFRHSMGPQFPFMRRFRAGLPSTRRNVPDAFHAHDNVSQRLLVF